MVTIKELREYKNSLEFQDFLNKFQQDKEFEFILRQTNTIFQRDDDCIQSDNILTDEINLSSVEFEQIKNEINTNAESFFIYYKKFLFLYADEDLVNELDDEDDYEIEDYDEEMESYPSFITDNTLIGCMIDFYLLRNNQNDLFTHHKKLRIPNARKHSKALIDIYNNIFG